MDDAAAAAGRATRWRALVHAVVGVAALLLSSCTSTPAATVTWHERPLPLPEGDRLLLRDVVDCGGDWLVTGAVADREGETRPGAWFGDDLVRVPTSGGDLYGHHAIVYSSACHDGTVALLGAKIGGAHGNPRTSTFVGTPAGVRNVRAPFELYGGPDALSVHRMAAGADGFLIAGSRTSGAAVWTSADGRGFELHDHEPRLSAAAGEQTTALDAAYVGGRWLVLGAVNGRATVFSQVGDRWERTPLGPRTGFSEAQRVVPTRDGLLAVGVQAQRFVSWSTRDGRTWRSAGTLVTLADGAEGARFVTGLAATDDGAVASVSDGASYRLFRLHEGEWGFLSAPSRLPTSTGDHTATIGARGDQVLLLVDDGTRSRIWEATLPR